MKVDIQLDEKESKFLIEILSVNLVYLEFKENRTTEEVEEFLMLESILRKLNKTENKND